MPRGIYKRKKKAEAQVSIATLNDETYDAGRGGFLKLKDANAAYQEEKSRADFERARANELEEALRKQREKYSRLHAMYTALFNTIEGF